jgi:hypothetical protein
MLAPCQRRASVSACWSRAASASTIQERGLTYLGQSPKSCQRL